MSKKKKTVTAPRSFDPGKGRPKEYLAYLNWQEMQALQRLNGEGPYKGPRGIPSFVLGGFGSAGSGTYSSSGQQQKSSTTGARGPTGPRGEARASPAGTAGGGAGSVSRTSGSQEGSRQGGGGSGVGAGTSPSGTRGAGAARTVDSSGRTTGPSGPLSAPARTQPSADTSARQVAATNDASRALQSTSALKSDFQSGGIKQISVGPMGTPVTVGGQIKGAIRGVQKQASYAPVGSAFGPRAGLDRTVGTVSPSQIAADAAMNRLASGSNVLTGYPEKIQERVTPVPTSGPNRGLGTSPAAPSRYAAAAENIYAGANSPFADPGVQSYDPNTYNRVMGIPDSGVRRTTAPYSAPPAPTTPEQERAAMNALRDKYALYSVAATPKLNFNRDLASEGYSMNLPEQADIAGKLYQERLVSNPAGITREASPEGVAALDAADRAAFEASQRMQRFNPEAPEAPSGIKTSVTPAEQAAIERSYQRMAMPTPGYGLPSNYNTDPETLNRLSDVYERAGIGAVPPSGGAVPSRPRGAAGTYTQSYDVPSGDMVDLTQEAYERERGYDVRPPVSSGEYSGSPVQGGLTEEQRKQAEGELKRAGNVVRLGSGATGLATGVPVGSVTNRAYKYYSDAKLKELENYAAMTMSEKYEAEERDPSLVGWAGRLGIQSAHDQSHYTNWAAERGLTGSGARERGGNDGTNIGIAALPANRPAVTPSPGGGTGTSPPSGDRPYIHYQWDLGINIPSPGDPNYNDYQRYLEQRAAARAAYG